MLRSAVNRRTRGVLAFSNLGVITIHEKKGDCWDLCNGAGTTLRRLGTFGNSLPGRLHAEVWTPRKYQRRNIHVFQLSRFLPNFQLWNVLPCSLWLSKLNFRAFVPHSTNCIVTKSSLSASTSRGPTCSWERDVKQWIRFANGWVSPRGLVYKWFLRYSEENRRKYITWQAWALLTIDCATVTPCFRINHLIARDSAPFRTLV